VRYRKISTAIWVDERFRTFTDDGKLAFLYVLTHPAMTSVGAMRGTLPGLAAELGWPRRQLEQALDPALAHGMMEVNAAAAYIGLPNFLKHNPPENPNVCKAWASAIALIPECPQRVALVERCRKYLSGDAGKAKAFEEAFAKAFGEPFAEPFRESMAIPEQEQEQEAGAEETRDDAREARLPPGFQNFWRLYPKKVGMDAALSAWRKKRCEPVADEILVGLEKQTNYLTRDGGQYVPNPATWLNTGRWKDQPPAVTAVPRVSLPRSADSWAGRNGRVTRRV
jgi:hypothetical protein